MTNFRVVKDASDYIVVDASVAARSFAMVPRRETYAFDTMSAATEQAKKLTGTSVALMMIETPERFEEVADTAYGPAW